MDIQEIKQRFGIIGNAPELNRALEVAIQVAPTDLSVLISGESGVGKESFPQIIHNFSHRKHAKFIAINCGAIPEGTIDSELISATLKNTGCTSGKSADPVRTLIPLILQPQPGEDTMVEIMKEAASG